MEKEPHRIHNYHSTRPAWYQAQIDADAAGEGQNTPIRRAIIHSETVQPKLEINPPDDIYEKEADQVAESVVQRMEESCGDCAEESPTLEANVQDGIQRACADCEEEGESIQRSGEGKMEVSSDFQQELTARKGQGHALPKESRKSMETGIGADFSGVKVHTDGNADRLSREINAKAFTHGNDVFFKEGEFDTSTSEGNQLLAHELTHVVQQGGGEIKRDPDPDDPGFKIESKNKEERQSALNHLLIEGSASSWRILLFAQDSPYADVKDRVNPKLASWLRDDSAFRRYVDELANNPRGVLSDMAIYLLIANKLSGSVDKENYRSVVRQTLNSLKVTMKGLLYKLNIQNVSVDGVGAIPFKLDTTWLDTQLSSVGSMPLAELVSVGIRASNLADRLAVTEGAIQNILDVSGTLEAQKGKIGFAINFQLYQLLIQSIKVTGDTYDPAFDKIVKAIGEWPVAYSHAFVSDLQKGFLDSKKELDKTFLLKPTPRFKDAWLGFKAEVIVPLITENETLNRKLEALHGVIDSDVSKFESELKKLRPDVESIGDKVLYTVQAGNMMKLYKDLVITDAYKKHLDIEKTLKEAFTIFAALAQYRDESPGDAKSEYDNLLTNPVFQEALEDIEEWNEMLDGELQFALFLAGVAIIIASIYSAGAAGAAMGAFLGEAATLGGEIAIGIAILATEGTAFHFTNRMLRTLVFQEGFFDEKFLGDWLETILLFGALKGSAKIYSHFVSPKFVALSTRYPKYSGMFGVGKFVAKQGSLFAFFQAWTVASLAIREGEFLGPGDKKFWDIAKMNAMYLGAVQIGMAASRPVLMPPGSKIPADFFELNNKEGKALKVEMEVWKRQRNPSKSDAKNILERAREILKRRLELFEKLREKFPNEISKEELSIIRDTIAELISSIEISLKFQGLDLLPSETRPDTFYYRGDFKLIEADLKSRGYMKIEFLPDGRVTMETPGNESITFIRLGDLPLAEIKPPNISKLVINAGYDWTRVKAEFGSDGKTTPNLLLYRAWNKNWRPGKPIPEDIKAELALYYKKQKEKLIRDRYGDKETDLLKPELLNMLTEFDLATLKELIQRIEYIDTYNNLHDHYGDLVANLETESPLKNQLLELANGTDHGFDIGKASQAFEGNKDIVLMLRLLVESKNGWNPLQPEDVETRIGETDAKYGLKASPNEIVLADGVQSDFYYSRFESRATTSELSLFRIFGGAEKLGGCSMTGSPMVNVSEVVSSQSVLGNWGNAKLWEAKIVVPENQALAIGLSAPKVGENLIEFQRGEGVRFELDQNWLDQGWKISVRAIGENGKPQGEFIEIPGGRVREFESAVSQNDSKLIGEILRGGELLESTMLDMAAGKGLTTVEGFLDDRIEAIEITGKLLEEKAGAIEDWKHDVKRSILNNKNKTTKGPVFGIWGELAAVERIVFIEGKSITIPKDIKMQGVKDPEFFVGDVLVEIKTVVDPISETTMESLIKKANKQFKNSKYEDLKGELEVQFWDLGAESLSEKSLADLETLVRNGLRPEKNRSVNKVRVFRGNRLVLELSRNGDMVDLTYKYEKN